MLYLTGILIFLAGIIIGGFLFSDTRPRAILNWNASKTPSTLSEACGLLASVIVQKAPGLIPEIVLETDKTIVFKHPRPQHDIHYIIVPKKDIKNVGELSNEDLEYVLDLFTTIYQIIRQTGLKNYRLWTNGPGKQDVTYLHFHLGAEDSA